MTLMKLLAIDLGASSGRVMQAIYNGHSIQLSEVHRFKNEPMNVNDGLYWNILHLFGEIKIGIKKASADGIPIRSISVDTWGVDYAYLDQNGDLLYQPHCYRDNRMGQYEETFYKKISKETLFEETGVQPACINTVLQIFADLQEKPHLARVAERVLFMPDLINYLLSGVLSSEYTIASSSGLLNINSQTWSDSVFETLGIPKKWFGEVTQGGKVLRSLSPRITQELKIEPFDVIAGAGHDTAAAVLAIPYASEQPTAFISCGTWSLVGLESQNPVTSQEALAANLTNEGCFDGRYRILKNTTGLWIIQELQRDWRLQGQDISFAEMVTLARNVTNNRSWINPNDAIFAAPGDMEAKVKERCHMTNQPVPQSKGEVVRVVLESLAFAYRQTVEQIESLTGQKIKQIHMVGGGIQNELLCQLTADVSQKPVLTGPIEASALGNILAQLLTLGEIQDRQTAQKLIKDSEKTKQYQPQEGSDLAQSYQEFQASMKVGS